MTLSTNVIGKSTNESQRQAVAVKTRTKANGISMSPPTTTSTAMQKAYEEALVQGWRVVPFRRNEKGDPKPCITFSDAQDNPKKAFAILAGRCDGLLLSVSSIENLAALDFDDADIYDAFRSKFPELAGRCPTVKTQRGYHVYFQMSRIEQPRKYPHDSLPIDVFLGKGHLALPPSIAKDGSTVYTWINPWCRLPTIDDINEILPTTIARPGGVKYLEGLKNLSYLSTGIVPNTIENQWKNARHEVPPSLISVAASWYESHPSLVGMSVLDPCGEIAAYLNRTLPPKKGTRNKKLLTLVRLLRRVAPTASASDLTDLAFHWITEAIRRGTTNEFEPDPTVQQFQSCWDRYNPDAASLIHRHFDVMNSSVAYPYDPARLKGVTNHFPYRRLCAYCRAASRDGKPFQMAVSVVEDICFQPESKSASQYIKKLCSSGIIEQTKAGKSRTKGQKTGGSAAWYRNLDQ